MSIEQQLINKGFTKYIDSLEKGENTYKYSYQLCVRDEQGNKKYFINVNLFDYNKTGYKERLPPSVLEDLQPSFTVQYKTKQGETFNVDYLEKDVDKALEFYENMFQTLDLECYEEIY